MLRKAVNGRGRAAYATITILGLEATLDIGHTPHQLLLIIGIHCRPPLQILHRRIVAIGG